MINENKEVGARADADPITALSNRPQSITTGDPKTRPTAAERFEAFNDANPHVLRVLLALADEWVRRAAGRKLGIAALFERCRWELALTTVGDEYKLNNDHRAYYARLISELRPEHANLFEFRRSAADEWARSRHVPHIPSPREAA